MSRVSIVIPTLNEAAFLERTLNHLRLLHPAPWEILVVDGGSEDETVEIAKSAGISVISERAGRSPQMNLGAKVVTGDSLCFLHADTLVPDDLVAVIQKNLADPTVACGGFVSIMEGAHTTRWLTSFHNYLKTYYAPLLFKPQRFFQGLRLLFGDQVIFCRRADFLQCGGFHPELLIMEEADLCLKLVEYGRITLVNRTVRSSDRRVAKWGALKANIIYLYIGFLWGIGVSTTYLKRFYKEIR